MHTQTRRAQDQTRVCTSSRSHRHRHTHIHTHTHRSAAGAMLGVTVTASRSCLQPSYRIEVVSVVPSKRVMILRGADSDHRIIVLRDQIHTQEYPQIVHCVRRHQAPTTNADIACQPKTFSNWLPLDVAMADTIDRCHFCISKWGNLSALGTKTSKNNITQIIFHPKLVIAWSSRCRDLMWQMII